jgi:hypothetical protein
MRRKPEFDQDDWPFGNQIGFVMITIFIAIMLVLNVGCILYAVWRILHGTW